jgi:AcrR family transcriptional regulator
MAEQRPVIWARPERGARGPRPAYDRASIARAAIRIADADGIDAVSIRRVAAEIGAAPTALYRYLDRKDELFDLMVDAVIGEREHPELTGDWRTDLRTMAVEVRKASLAHRWLVPVSAGRATLGPNSLYWMERTLGLFDGYDLSADEILLNLEVLTSFITGHLLGELSEAQSNRDRESWLAEQGAYGDALATGDEFPRMRRIMVEAQLPHAPDRLDRSFAAGVERVLDGIAPTLRRTTELDRDPGHPSG